MVTNLVGLAGKQSQRNHKHRKLVVFWSNGLSQKLLINQEDAIRNSEALLACKADKSVYDYQTLSCNYFYQFKAWYLRHLFVRSFRKSTALEIIAQSSIMKSPSIWTAIKRLNNYPFSFVRYA